MAQANAVTGNVENYEKAEEKDQGRADVPPLIDPRGPRTNQAIICALACLALVTGWYPLALAAGLVLAAGAIGGPRYALFIRGYQQFIKPRLKPPRDLEDPRGPRFAASLGGAMLLAASVLLYIGASTAGWALVAVVAALAGLAAITNICVGCHLYVLLKKVTS